MRASLALAAGMVLGLSCAPGGGVLILTDGRANVDLSAVAAELSALGVADVRVDGPAPRWRGRGASLEIWPTCVAAGGAMAVRAADVPKLERAGDRVVLVTSSPIAVDLPDRPCSRVFGAAPPGTGVVLISDRELRGRCSSMPQARAIAAVAAHELGHTRGQAPPGPQTTCDARGCHCDAPGCLMGDDSGGCPQPGARLCARCAG